MGYISGFKHDIFISYAHVDNMVTSGEVEGWIEQFHKDLQVKLSQRIGRVDKIRIWRDKKRLQGNHLFDKVIRKSVEESAIFLALTSAGYLNSDYCRQELMWFDNHARKMSLGIEIGNRLRIVNVKLNNIPREKWPQEYDRTTGFTFHDSSDSGSIGEPSIPATDLYRKQLRILTDALFDLIESFVSSDSNTKMPNKKSAQNDLYIGEVADSLRLVKKKLSNRLIKDGLTIHSNIPPPYEVSEHKSAVVEAIKKSILTVHLLDHLGGAYISEQENITYPKEQVKIGIESKKSQIIWVPKNLESRRIEDENQRVFLEELEKGLESQKYDFLRGTSEELYHVIADKITQLKNNDKQIQTQLSALLDIHEKDEGFTLDVTKSLLDRNIIPYINPHVDRPTENINKLISRLKMVEAVIIVYGKVDSQWVISRFEENVKTSMIEKIPVKSFCILLAPPDKDPSSIQTIYPFLNPRMLDNRNGFDPASLRPLYEDLGIKETSI